MTSSAKPIEQVQNLIKKGELVLSTRTANQPNLSRNLHVDTKASNEWDAQALNFLISLLGSDHIYTKRFQEKGITSYRSSVESGLGILKAVQDDLSQGRLEKTKITDVTTCIEQIINRFHIIARQLRSRHHNRETISVADEYDVQDLLHALLCLYFDDIRPEEYTPSYAGKSSRLDFLLKREKVVIEVKRTSPSLGAKEVSSQLIEDIERYKAHPDCKALYCFVYDPEGYIPNPRGLEDDLRRDDNPFPVRVQIRPA